MYYESNIILDFDGTIFRVFANHNLNNLVIKIYELTRFYNVGFSRQNDAFDVFEIIRKSNLNEETKANLLKQIQTWFVEEEIKAIDSGIIIDGFTDFLDFASKTGKNIAIASNNSIDCIKIFLGKLGSDIRKKYQIPVIGRDAEHPERMKPSTYMLEKVCQTNNWSRRDTLYIGDHPRDYECALKFGCRFIGMTPTSSKKERLTKYNSTIITVDNFFEFMKLLA